MSYNSPVNIATIAGQPMTMSCGISSGDGLILWKFQPIGSIEAIFLFNGYNVSKDRPKFSLSVLQPKGLHLVNNDPDIEDAGSYQCIQTIQKQKSYRQKVRIVGLQLTVFSKSRSFWRFIFLPEIISTFYSSFQKLMEFYIAARNSPLGISPRNY